MMSVSALDWVCLTLLILSLAVLDGRCFIVRDSPPSVSSLGDKLSMSLSSLSMTPTLQRDVTASSVKSQHRKWTHHRQQQQKQRGGGGLVKKMRLSTNKAPLHSYHSGVTCEYNGKVYPPGEYQISPCVTCTCERTGELRCTSETCAPEPGCIEYDRVPGQCCAQCLEYGCLHNGTGYPRGASIPAGPCTKCYCPWEVHADNYNNDKKPGGSSDPSTPVCMDFNCPLVKCVDAIVPRGHCCPFCPNGENCWLDDLVIPAGQDVWVDKCRSCYCPDGADADGAVTSKDNNVQTTSPSNSSMSRKSKPTSSESRRRQGYERKAMCYRHSGCIEW